MTVSIQPHLPSAYELLHDGFIALSQVEHHGVKIDTDYLDRATEDLEQQVKVLEKRLSNDKFFDVWKKRFGDKTKLGSKVQLGQVLFEELGYKCTVRTATGLPKVDEKILETIDHPFVKRYIRLGKLRDTKVKYLDGLRREMVEGFYHPNFNLHTARSYRSSSGSEKESYGCIAKGTRIEIVRDLSKNPDGIPIEDVRVGDYAYCYDKNCKLVIRKVLWAGKTGIREVIRIHWMSGTNGRRGFLDLTPEHRVRLADGRYVKAVNLLKESNKRFKQNKSSSTTRVLAMSRSYDRVFRTGEKKFAFDHRLVYENLVGSLLEGEEVHHLDENHLNNIPSNLTKMSMVSHRRLHAPTRELTKAKRTKSDYWRNLNKVGLFRILSASGGKITDIGPGYDALKVKAAELGVDLKVVKDRYDRDGCYITRGRIIRAMEKGRKFLQKEFGNNFYKIKRMLEQRGFSTERRWANQFGEFLPHNHKIIRIEMIEAKVDVYDIEVEGCHNFIAGEICVHNSSGFNFQNLPVRDPERAEFVRSCYVSRFEDGHVVERDYCLSGNTLVETIGGPRKIKDLVDSIGNQEEVYVYGYNFEQQRVGVAKVVVGKKTGVDKEVCKVKLDNGEEVVATPSHKFILRDGTKLPLKDLKPGMSLMPLYKKNVKGSKKSKVYYTKVYLNNGQSMLSHNLIALDVFGVTIKGSNQVVHHKDGNGTNNDASNLQVMGRAEHMRIHAKQGWENFPKEKRKNWDWQKSEENREQARKRMEDRKNTWTEKDWEEMGRRISESIKRRGGYGGERNPMYGKKQSEETKEKISNTKKGVPLGKPSWSKGHTKETHPSLKKLSESKKGKPGRLGVKNKKPLSEETRRRMSEAHQGKTFSEEARRKLSRSKEEYWKRRGKKNRICMICGKRMTAVTNTHLIHKHNITLEEYQKTYNHKVVSIEPAGREDVYNITVEGIHSYALSAGIIVNNCALEVNINYMYHQDPKMREYLLESDTDMHRDTCLEIYGLSLKQWKGLDPVSSKNTRYCAKNMFVFPQFYGDYYIDCARLLWSHMERMNLRGPGGIPMREHLRTKGITELGLCDPEQEPEEGTFEYHIKKIERDFWERRFPVFKRWRDNWWAEYKRLGWFAMHTGFRCTGIYRRNEVICYPAQGSAFHCLLWSLIRLQRYLRKHKMRTKIFGQIHDSIVADVPGEELQEYLEVSEQIMTRDIRKSWDWIIIPLKAEAEVSGVGESWHKKKKWERTESGLWRKAA